MFKNVFSGQRGIQYLQAKKWATPQFLFSKDVYKALENKSTGILFVLYILFYSKQG